MTVRYLISIRNIPWTVSNSELENYFSSFGMIKHAKVIFDRCGLSTGYGFVQFYDKYAMNKALGAVHILEEKKLFVIEGVKYLEGQGVVHLVNGWNTNFKSNVQDYFINKNYIEDRFSQMQYRNVKLNDQVSYENNNCDNTLSVVKQFLKHKHTQR